MLNNAIAVLMAVLIFSGCTKVIETSNAKVDLQDFTSDCSKVVIPNNSERDTNFDIEKGLLTVHWYDDNKGKDVGVVFRYKDQNCSESAKLLIQHVEKTSKLQMLPGAKDIPLFPGLQPETPPSKRYLIPKNTVDEVHLFYKDNLLSFGWTMQGEGEGVGNSADGPIKGKASIWFNEATLTWLRVNLYEYPDGRREIYLEDDFRENDKSTSNWQVSPVFDYPVTFQNGEKHIYQLQGIEGRMAFTAPNQFRVNIPDKHLWFFWGKKEELLGQKVKIIGLSKKTGESLNVFSAVIPKEYEGQSVDGIHINMPSGLSLPSTGLWRLYVIVGDKYLDSVIIDVQKNFDAIHTPNVLPTASGTSTVQFFPATMDDEIAVRKLITAYFDAIGKRDDEGANGSWGKGSNERYVGVVKEQGAWKINALATSPEVYDASKGQDNHSGVVTDMLVTWSPNHKMVAFLKGNPNDQSGDAYIWKVNEERPIQIINGGNQIKAFNWSPDSKFVLVDSGTSPLRFGQLISSTTMRSVLSFNYMGKSIFSSDSKNLAIGFNSGLKIPNSPVDPDDTFNLSVFHLDTLKLEHLLLTENASYSYLPQHWEDNNNIAYTRIDNMHGFKREEGHYKLETKQ